MTKRLSVIMDYENVLRTGHSTFAKGKPLQNYTIDPFRYACQIARVMNRGREVGDPDWVEVSRVEVFRGWPDARANPTGHALNQMQKQAWLTGHHGVVDVTLRPLRQNPQTKKWQEKGVDVLCALAFVRAARSGMYEHVVLASRDTDLAPAIDEAFRVCDSHVRIGAAKWYDPDVRETKGSLRAERSFHTTGLWLAEYEASIDPNVYLSRAERRRLKREEQ